MATKPIPEGYHSLSTYLAVDNAAEAIEYYKQVFGAKERMRMDGPEGKIGHAELDVGKTQNGHQVCTLRKRSLTSPS